QPCPEVHPGWRRFESVSRDGSETRGSNCHGNCVDAGFVLFDRITERTNEIPNRTDNGSVHASPQDAEKEIAVSLADYFDLDLNAETRLLVRFCQLVLRITFRFFFRLKFIGMESLPKDRPFLLCPNHQSYLDPFFIYAMLPPELLERTLFVADGGIFSRRSL